MDSDVNTLVNKTGIGNFAEQRNTVKIFIIEDSVLSRTSSDSSISLLPLDVSLIAPL